MNSVDLRTFETWLRARGARPATVKARVTVIAAALRVWPERPTADDLAAWLGREDLAAWSRVTYYSHARSWFRWLHETGRRADDPMAGMRAPRSPRGLPRPLTDGEVATALLASRGRLRLWLMLSLLAGLRAHEVAKLRREDVTAENIYVLGKGGRGDFVPTHPDLWALIAPEPPGFLFPSRLGGGPVTAHTVTVTVSAHFSALDIDGGLHRCRHTFGTRLLRSGVNIRVVQRLMRHSSLETTARYLAIDDNEASAAIRALAA